MLKNEEFEHISHEIVKLFPHESKEIYFIPPIRKRYSKEGKAGISRGKLVDRFRNDIKFINSINKYQKKIRKTLLTTQVFLYTNRESM